MTWGYFAFVLLALFIVTGVFAGWSRLTAERAAQAGPEIQLPLLLAAALILLLFALATTTMVFHRLGLVDSNEALGLPKGSVRAVIALSLILIFAIMAIFLFDTLSKPRLVTATGLTQSQVDQIPAREIFRIRESGDRFDVDRLLVFETADEIAKQVITTVSTLVVATSAFYFGANSVSSAQHALSGPSPFHVLIAGGPSRRLKKEDDGWQDLELTAIAVPKGLALTASVLPAEAGKITSQGEDVFLYEPSDKPEFPVTLRFAIAVKPDVFSDVRLDGEE